MEGTKLTGDKATKFVAWLSLVKGFLPQSMSLEEAAEIFLRRDKEKSSNEHKEKNHN